LELTDFCSFRGYKNSIWRVFPCQNFSSFFGSEEKSDEFGTVFAVSISIAATLPRNLSASEKKPLLPGNIQINLEYLSLIA